MQKTAKYYWRMRLVEYIRIDTPPTSCVCENNMDAVAIAAHFAAVVAAPFAVVVDAHFVVAVDDYIAVAAPDEGPDLLLF